MSKIITELAGEINKRFIVRRDTDGLLISRNNVDLYLYDRNNLLGFKLTGTVQGQNIYIVHDTDNYDRANKDYRYLFDEVRTDMRHIVEMFVQDRIRVNVAENGGWFRKKKISVTIPDADGNDNLYDGLTVNTTNFYQG